MGFFERLRALGASKTRTAREWYEASVQLAAQKKPAETLEALKQALYAGPETHELSAMIGFALEELGDYDTAIRAHENACVMAPGWALAHLRLGQALFRHRRVDAAVDALGEAVVLSDYGAEPCLRYAQALEVKGDSEEALSHYHIAARAAPESVEALRALGKLQRDRGHVYGAVRTLRRVLERAPQDHDSMALLGCLLSEQGRHREAVEILAAVLRARPHAAEAHAHLAVAHSRSGAHAQALSGIEDALALDPQSARLLSLLGSIQRAAGQTEAAIETHRRVVELAPGLAQAHIELGLALEASGEREDARAALAVAEKLSPDDPVIALAKADLQDSWEKRIDEVLCERPSSMPPHLLPARRASQGFPFPEFPAASAPTIAPTLPPESVPLTPVPPVATAGPTSGSPAPATAHVEVAALGMPAAVVLGVPAEPVLALPWAPSSSVPRAALISPPASSSITALSSVVPRVTTSTPSVSLLGKAWTPMPFDGPSVFGSDEEQAFVLDASEDVTQPSIVLPVPRVDEHAMLMPLARNVFASAPAQPHEDRPLPSRSITGELDVFPLSEVLDFLALRRSTGILAVRSDEGDGEGEVWLKAGLVTGASSPHMLDIITIAFELSPAAGPGGKPAEEAIEDARDAVSGDALTRACRAQIEGALGELMSWARGAFTFSLEGPERVSGLVGLEAGELLRSIQDKRSAGVGLALERASSGHLAVGRHPDERTNG